MKKNSNQLLLDAIYFKIGAMKEAQRMFKAQLAPNFNIFNYLRSDEMGLSRIIADLLDTNGAHGQSELFLRAFANKLSQEWIVDSNFWTVATEKQANGQRRIDVYLSSELGVVAIENKPWADDQGQQLSDYSNFIKRDAVGKKHLLIYLSNSDPTEKSMSTQMREDLVKAGNFQQMSFHELVEWLDHCAAQVKALAVRVFIEEIARFVRININGDLDVSEEKEVISEIRKSASSIESSFHISNSMSALKQELLGVFRDDLSSELKDKGYRLEWDGSMSNDWRAWTGFGVRFNQSDKFYLRFEFEGSQLWKMYWGIRRNDESVPHDSELWGRINEEMSRVFGVGKIYVPWWPWATIVPDREFDASYKNWGVSERPWIEMNERKLAKKIVDIAKRVDDVFSECSYLLQAKSG